jgi:hypothetical protein
MSAAAKKIRLAQSVGALQQLQIDAAPDGLDPVLQEFAVGPSECRGDKKVKENSTKELFDHSVVVVIIGDECLRRRTQL